LTNQDIEAISIVIPFKNEQNNLPDFFQSIINQQVSKAKYELIFVDDNSDDDSYNLVKTFIKNLPNAYLIKNLGEGKKQAVITGVSFAHYDWILQTDADCMPNPFWIETVYTKTTNAADLWILPVLISQNRKTLFSVFEKLEFISLQASSAAAALCGCPLMANAANLLYKKNLLLNNIEDYRLSIPSGDDVFLLHIAKRKAKVDYLKNVNALVYTKPNHNIKDFVKQRLRWGAKAKYYRDTFTIILTILVYLTNLLTPVLFFLFLFAFYPLITGLLFFAKFLVDFILLFSFALYFSEHKLMKNYVIVWILYPFYIILVGTLSIFTNVNWKK